MAHQRNKAHKTKFRTKGSVKKAASGKQSKGSAKQGTCHAGTLSKAGFSMHDKERRRQVTEARRAKARQQMLHTRRFGSDRTGSSGGSRLVSVLPLSASSDAVSARGELETAAHRLTSNALPTGVEVHAHSGPHAMLHDHIRYTVCTPHANEIFQVMDAVMVCDVTILVVRVGESCIAPDAEADVAFDVQSTASTWYNDLDLGVDKAGRELLSSMNAQGVPNVILVLQGLRSIASVKRRNKLAKLHLRYLRSILPKHQIASTVHTTDTHDDCLRLLRALKECGTADGIVWREARPYLLAEEIAFEGNHLHVTGYLRGKNITANQLAHLTNYGTYAIHHLSDGKTGEMIESANEELQPALDHICTTNTNADAEQTWPTEEDFKTEMRALRVPEGTSAYQAAWMDFDENRMLFEDEETSKKTEYLLKGGGGSKKNADGKKKMGDARSSSSSSSSSVCSQSGVSVSASAMDRAMREEEEAGDDLDENEEQDGEEEDEHPCADEMEDDPDYIDLEMGQTARQRLAKYRGLNHFHQEWDPKENLPPSYSKIFAVPEFKRIVKSTTLDSAPAKVGTYLTVVLRNVSPLVYQSLLRRPTHPVILSGLLPFEQQYSVLHCNMFRTDDEFEEPLPSKHRALYQIGFRRVLCHPLYGDIGRGDRTRYARAFLHGEQCRLATFFGPITHTPCAVLGYIRRNQTWHLVLHGSVMAPKPDLLLLKRAFLTGHPAKVHKRQVVVKYMFFNAEDVAWFAPVELRTKHGHRGKIQKAIGSHGVFKAGFKNIIQQHDTIYLEVWKRVFPKWNTRAYDLTVHADGRVHGGDDMAGPSSIGDEVVNEVDLRDWLQRQLEWKKKQRGGEHVLTEQRISMHNNATSSGEVEQIGLHSNRHDEYD